MADELIINLNTGSILDSTLGILGDPTTGTLTQTSFHAMKDYFTAGITGSGGTVNTGSLLLTSSFNTYTSSTAITINNIFASQSNYETIVAHNAYTASVLNQFGQYELTSSFIVFSGSVATQFANITGSGGSVNTGSLLLTSSFNAYTSSTATTITNIFASQSNYETIVAHNAYTSSVLNQFGQYELTSSFNTFSSSVATQFANITGSAGINTGSLLLTASFNTYTSSTAIQLTNIFASESNYLPTSSFTAFTSSILTQVINVYASESNYLLTSSFTTFSSSVATQFSNITASGAGDSIQIYNGTGSSFAVSNSINVVYVDPTSIITTCAISLPATASSNNSCDFFFGGIIPSGQVISNISFVTGSAGQKILQYTSASAVSTGESIGWKYRSSTATWYRKY